MGDHKTYAYFTAHIDKDGKTQSVREHNTSVLRIVTEKQLWEHIDHSLEQAKAGEGRDADEVIDEFLKQFTE